LQKEIESGFQASKRNIQNAYSIHETKVSPELYETTKNAPAYGGYKILQYTQYKINRLRVILNLLESEKLDIEDTIKVVRLYNLYKGISLGDQLNAENLKKQQEQKKNEQKQHSGNKDKPKSNPNLSFSIQIASFENPQIPPDKSEFREYKTDEVRVERLHNGTAYVVGKLTYEQTADELRKALNFGYSDAFKVAYLNGIRISMEEAEAIMRGDKNTKPPINTVSASDNAILFDKKLAEKIVTGEDISKTKGLVYSVYIGSFQKDVAWKEIKNISPIYKDLSAAGVIKYNAGLYHTKNAAIAVLASVKKAGLKDAYVVAFNDGKRIGLQEQIKTVANIVFSVQISVGSSELSAADKAKFEALKKYGELDKRSLGNNTALYSIGKFSSFSDADGAKNKIVAEGIKDAFVIALKNGVEIPVSEALKELKK